MGKKAVSVLSRHTMFPGNLLQHVFRNRLLVASCCTLFLWVGSAIRPAVAAGENADSSQPAPATVSSVSDPRQNTIQVASLAASNMELPYEGRRSILKGWDHLFELLIDQGSDPTTVAWLLSDARMPARAPLYFSLEPRESHAMYRRLNSRQNRRHAIGYYLDNEAVFVRAEKEFKVPRAVILALLQVETSCGRNTGREPVFYRLARLASAAAPDNIEENFLQKQKAFRLLPLSRVQDRAVELQKIFLRHTAETIEVAKRLQLHPLELRGSAAGAIGIPQFLPGNVSDFGADGDGNDVVNVFDPADAIMSVGKFLKEHGWKYEEPYDSTANRLTIHHYNRSEPYVNTVIAMGTALRRELPVSSNK